LYTKRLGQLGVDVSHRENSTHYKDRILKHVHGMKAFKEGREAFLASEDDVSSLLRHRYQSNSDECSIMMTEISNTIRRDVFNQATTFPGCI